MTRRVAWVLLVLVMSLNSLWAKDSLNEKPNLLVYCGITMVKPIREISKVIEKKYNCVIKIVQGGSQDLYDSLKYSKKGDLYLPGSLSYRNENLKDGLLLDKAYIGDNKAAIFVQKGNPKGIKNLDSLVDKNIATILCNPGSGSIGREEKEVIIKFKNRDFFDKAFYMATEIGTDSRNLNKTLIEKSVDMTINWKASGLWSENSPYIDIIDIDEKYAQKKKLVLNLLSFSKHPDIAKAFMKFAISKEGKKIMKNYGFR